MSTLFVQTSSAERRKEIEIEEESLLSWIERERRRKMESSPINVTS
jgi:hypothetical protein